MARRQTAIKLSFQYPDLDDLRNEFRRLPKTLAARYMEKVMKAAVKPGLRKLREITPRGPTGNLKKSVRQKTKKYPKDGTAIGLVGYTVGKGAKGYHQGFLEFGTKERQTKGRFASSLRWPKGEARGEFEIVNSYNKRRQARRVGRQADRLAARAAKQFASSLGSSTKAKQSAAKVIGLRAKQAGLQAAGQKLKTRPRPPGAFFKSAPAGQRVTLGKMPVGGRSGKPPVRTAFDAARGEMVGILREQMAVQLELAAISQIKDRAKRRRRVST